MSQRRMVGRRAAVAFAAIAGVFATGVSSAAATIGCERRNRFNRAQAARRLR